MQTAPGQPPASTPSASAESRKIVSSSSSVATADGGIDSAFRLRRRGSRDQILLNRADLHTGACASGAGRGEGRAAARVPAASIVLLRGEAARRGKRGGPQGRGRGLPTTQQRVNKRPGEEGDAEAWQDAKGVKVRAVLTKQYPLGLTAELGKFWKLLLQLSRTYARFLA